VFPVKRKLRVVQGKSMFLETCNQPESVGAVVGRLAGSERTHSCRHAPVLPARSLLYLEAAFSRLDGQHCWLAGLTFGPTTSRTENLGAWLGSGLFRSLLSTRVVTRIGAHRCHRVGPVVEELADGPQKSGRAKGFFEQGHVSAL
jgi:hypothetical protein